MEGPIKDICYYCLPWVRAPFLGGKDLNFSWRLLSSDPCNLGRNNSIPNSRVRPVSTASLGSGSGISTWPQTGRDAEAQFQMPGWRHWGFVLFLLRLLRVQDPGSHFAPTRERGPQKKAQQGRRKWEQFLKTSVQPGIQAFHKSVISGLFSNMNQQITFFGTSQFELSSVTESLIN